MKRLFIIVVALVTASCGGTGSTEQQVCEPVEKFCKGQDVFICEADGVNFEFVKTCGEGEECQSGECVPEGTCKADCEGKVCGDDGCGGLCGNCAEDQHCSGGQCADGPCEPDCGGKDCGDDGCEGECGQCGEGENCQAGECVDGPCVPDCGENECGDDGCEGNCGECGEGKTCVEGSCLCEFSDCDGVCCPEGQACHEGACCTPTCADVECGDDGCGGLCNGCLDIVYDDGSTETAYGYGEEPGHAPTQVVCVVRFDLPEKNMKLTRFTAGWMWGLYNLQVPYELVYVVPDDMECDQGAEGIWYKEWCKTEPDKLVKIGDFLPFEPYTAMEEEDIGDVVFPSETVYLAAVFTIDQYPFYVCPMDDSGEGDYAFMMSDHIVAGDKVVIQGASFHTKDENKGVIPFSIRVEATE